MCFFLLFPSRGLRVVSTAGAARLAAAAAAPGACFPGERSCLLGGGGWRSAAAAAAAAALADITRDRRLAGGSWSWKETLCRRAARPARSASRALFRTASSRTDRPPQRGEPPPPPQNNSVISVRQIVCQANVFLLYFRRSAGWLKRSPNRQGN